ncbi:MAG TPA: DUF3738 domain-containing protein [Bryobacteraceae bacterium]
MRYHLRTESTQCALECTGVRTVLLLTVAIGGAYTARSRCSSCTNGSRGVRLLTAIQEQLGLKLEPATAPFDTIIIDYAERPDEN